MTLVLHHRGRAGQQWLKMKMPRPSPAGLAARQRLFYKYRSGTLRPFGVVVGLVFKAYAKK